MEPWRAPSVSRTWSMLLLLVAIAPGCTTENDCNTVDSPFGGIAGGPLLVVSLDEFNPAPGDLTAFEERLVCGSAEEIQALLDDPEAGLIPEQISRSEGCGVVFFETYRSERAFDAETGELIYYAFLYDVYYELDGCSVLGPIAGEPPPRCGETERLECVRPANP